MNNEYYGLPTTPNDDYLAHYGVKGMKWGVRKARESGNERALGRQYRKAAKKLAKLEKRAASGKKYAKRAAALGLGAAAAGGVAATGTRGIAAVTKGAGRIAGDITSGAGNLALRASNVMRKAGIRGSGKMAAAGTAMYRAGRTVRGSTAAASRGVEAWGKGNSIGKGASNIAGQALNSQALSSGIGRQAKVAANKALRAGGHGGLGHQANKLAGISNSGYTRLAGAALGAGLAGAAGYNAYRAASTKRAAKKAAQFRAEMNKAFAGTQYANGAPKRKRRR